jgi:hypothetical protein
MAKPTFAYVHGEAQENYPFQKIYEGGLDFGRDVFII